MKIFPAAIAKICVLFFIACVARSEESKVKSDDSRQNPFVTDPFMIEYQKLLDDLQHRHKLNEEQLRKKIMDFHFPEQVFLKSNLGDIGGRPYPERVVQTDLKANNITIDGKTAKHWSGESYRTSELVLLEGDEVIFSKRYEGQGSRDQTLVLFRPERVDYFYWEKFEGGNFKRDPKR